MITGASSGIGKVVALKVAQAGGIPILVARGKDKLEDTRAEIEARGGRAFVYGCDLSDLEAIDALCEQLVAEHESIDFVVNNAGRSIRRSLALSEDRFHDFERTMQLNYFGAIRLVMGLLPRMREQQHGHVVNISSIGVQTNPPRFSAYVASKAALDAWSNVVASELVGDGVSFSTIHMPLVRTPMIAPTKIYQKFPTISPAQAADMAIARDGRPAARGEHRPGQPRAPSRTRWRPRPRSGCCTWPTRCSPTRAAGDRATTTGRRRPPRSSCCWPSCSRACTGSPSSDRGAGPWENTDPSIVHSTTCRPVVTRSATSSFLDCRPGRVHRRSPLTQPLQDPGYSAASRPSRCSANRSCVAVTPEPQ